MDQNDLSETAVASQLTSRWLGQVYRYFPELPSTNAWLRDNLDQLKLPHGTVALTDFQSAGKGRLGRSWSAPAGSAILHSYLLFPDWPAQQANWLTMMAGVAVVRAAQAVTGVQAQLKWPNDLVVERDGVPRKWCGILLEGDIQEERLNSAVIGIGINVNLTAEMLPADVASAATSLRIETGQLQPRRPLLLQILSEFELLYERAERGDSPHPEWSELLVTLGRRVQVTNIHQNQAVVGMAEAADVWGNLLVRDDESGELHTIAAGDVTLRG